MDGIAVSGEFAESLSDEDLVRRILDGERELFEILLRRHNQRIFRLTRSVLQNEAEAEDAMQEAYLKAYGNLAQFAGKSQFSTWLSKIALHEAFSRSRKNSKFVPVKEATNLEALMNSNEQKKENPQDRVLQKEISVLLENAIDRLPQKYKSVFILRTVEGCSTAQTAETLDLTEEAVKTRLFRAHKILQKIIRRRLGLSKSDVFRFAGERCDRIVKNVMDRILASS